jgi:hypothetical protein
MRRGGVAVIKKANYPNLQTFENAIKLSIYKKIPGVMISLRNPRRRSPYWNIWRFVLASWVIRNPRPIFVGLGICIMVIYNAVTK